MHKYIDYHNVKRAVSCDRLLADKGFLPVHVYSGYRLYYSPFRAEKGPSFSVRDNGRWFDFGLPGGGDVIDLAVALGLATTKKEAAAYLVDYYAIFDAHSSSTQASPVSDTVKTATVSYVTKVCGFSSRHLRQYIEGRGIPVQLAEQYCRQVHYRCGDAGKEYFGMGLRNVCGGYAVRNAYAKVAIAPVGISVIGTTNSGSAAVFEGVFDYLSWLVDRGNPAVAAVVLNSTANVPAAIPVLSGYDTLHCYLDRDAAGAKALLRLRRECSGDVLDQSGRYEGFKDYNEYIMSKL